MLASISSGLFELDRYLYHASYTASINRIRGVGLPTDVPHSQPGVGGGSFVLSEIKHFNISLDVHVQARYPFQPVSCSCFTSMT